MKTIRPVRATSIAVLLFFALLGGSDAGRPISFNRDVRPILSDNCFACHGPDQQQRASELRLDQSESAHELAIVPGDSQASELIQRLISNDPDQRMPPADSGKHIEDEELEVLRRWIQEGAPYEAYWAYVAPKSIDLTVGRSTDSNQVEPDQGAIDTLVRRNLSESELDPSPRAERRALLRRLSLDLTGLPPTYDEVRSFIADDSGTAYERQVDRLLASPAFGERLGAYWLDLVRYADTVGYHGDQDHNIAPYRNYVIDSLNDNLPLDQFSREQLAGDLLDNPSIEQQIASGYNRLLQTTHEGGLQPKEYLAIYAADRVRNFSAVWMAATLGCAQCHDHKYDPYTSNDFYSLVAFFADIDEEKHFKNGTNALPTRREPEIDVLGRTDRLRLDEIEAILRASSTEANTDRIEALKQERDAIQTRRLRTMVTKAIEPRTIRYLPRGNWLDESGPIMQPAIPEFLGEIKSIAELSGNERPTRLDLAIWLFDVDHGIGGLTARVFANRLWYLFSGRGISPTLDDFGGQGRPPSNPDLLDYLAGVLINSRWDIKATVREIVLSETYRQSVQVDQRRRQVDPELDFAASQSGHRLPAETVRDSVLELSGLLDHSIGGRSVRPYQPAGYYRHLNFPTRRYASDQGSMQWRRGIYTHWQRQFLHPMLKALDAPSREECTASRSRSNTPLEALALLNDPTFVIASKAMAARVLREVPTEDDSGSATAARINHAMRVALARDATSFEQDVLGNLFRDERLRYESDTQACKQFLETPDDVSIQWPADSSLIERAAWSSISRAILNLHETLYRP